jgi:hypothetical protein
MSKKKHHAANIHTRQEKKEKFQSNQEESSGKSSRAIALIVILVMGVAVLYVILGGGEGTGTGSERSQALDAPGQDVRIPLSEVGDGQAKSFFIFHFPFFICHCLRRSSAMTNDKYQMENGK